MSIRSEIEKISEVIVCEPGKDHDLMRPEHIQEYLSDGTPNPDYLLFDDLIDTQLAIKEHQEFTDIIKLFTGSDNCIDFWSLFNREHDLNIDINENEPGLFDKVMPNLIFTRDLAVVIGETIVTTWAAKKVRNPENILSSYVIHHEVHEPDENKLIHFHNIAPNTSLEGGDVTIFNNDLVIIGISERTTKEAIKVLEPIIFNEGFNRIYAVELPKKRSMMHIDTVFTRISKEDVLYFPPLFDLQEPNIYNITSGKSISNVKPMQINLIDLLNQDGYKTNGIKCGGELELNQYREQWTDGANAFCLQPGIAVGYTRNIHTIEELKKNGYKIMTSNEFISKFDNISDDKIFITLNSTELCRGRGGPRCLTLPLSRGTHG